MKELLPYIFSLPYSEAISVPEYHLLIGGLCFVAGSLIVITRMMK